MEELLRGFPLLVQQTNALLKKNLILAWRSKKTTFLQLFSSFFFIAILFTIQKVDDYRAKNPIWGNAVTDPEALVNPSIPSCEEKYFINVPCYDFVWSGSGNKRIESIVIQIMANNPGRPIPPGKVKSFTTKEELNKWLVGNGMRVPGALHFVESDGKEIRFGVQTNSSSYVRVGRQTEDPIFKFQIPLQHAASRETFRSLIGDPNFSCDVGMKEFAHPAEESVTHDEGDALEQFGFMFFFATAMFGFVFQISSLVQEKEHKLRQTMSIMGLYDSAYWISWFIWEGFMAFLSSLLIVVFGAMFQMDLFLKNNFVLVYLLFFLFALSMVGFAFMISTFIHKSASTTSIGFFIFVISFVTMLFSVFFYNAKTKQIKRITWSLFPPNPFSQGLRLLLDASGQGGMSWSKRAAWCLDAETRPCFSINFFYAWLISLFFLWSILALYLDNILPNSAGVRKSVLYFLMPSYWTGRGDNKLKEDTTLVDSGSTATQDDFSTDDEDVREEENSVKEAARQGTIDPNVAVQLRGLAKTYSKKIKMNCHHCCFCCFSCTCKMTKPYDAVKGLWMNFPKDQLFCLLGPNGAGKTTSISCLTGITPVTCGDAIVYGNSIRSSIGMSAIRRMMGICAQFDALWDALSGQEHLELFARIKGLPRASIKLEAQTLLADVKMDKVSNLRAGSYSGGMKRRISFAIALIGNPKLLILDEPTTGMDPVTRRQVWNLIEKAKQGRSIILTTHSMVEAEILSDRIGIMAKGRLRCIGTSTMLKSRFGGGYSVKLIFSKVHPNVMGEGVDINEEHRQAVKLFFRQHLNTAPKEESNFFLTFVLPNAREEALADFFYELESKQTDFGIMNIQLSLATLEEIFVSVAKKAELETTDPKESMNTLTLTSGESLQVPLGAKYVRIPGTESTENPQGLMVEIAWQQDENGNFCISSHSSERPVPPSLQPVASSSVSSHENVSSRKGLVTGIVLE